MSGKDRREVVEGKMRCGSGLHKGHRMRPIEEFCKAKTPDGLSYSCKVCRTKENKRLCHDRYKRWKQKNPRQAILSSCRSSAKKKGIEFTLTLEDIQIPEECPVLGIPIIADNKPRTDNSPSVDRIDNSKGYVSENIVVVSWRANTLKKDASLEELQKIADFYRKVEK